MTFAPIGVRRVEGEVTGIGLAAQTLPYDRLVFALGSRLHHPNLAGLAESAFDVDTYNGGARLDGGFLAQ